MSNFNPNKCYVEESTANQNSSNWTNITYYFQIISSFIYTFIVVYLFFIFITHEPSSSYRYSYRRRHSVFWDYFLLYVLGWPNLKIFFNSLFAPRVKLDFDNGLISVNNKPLSVDRIKKMDIVEIKPYHSTWRFGDYPAFNFSGYKKSIISINTQYGDISFYVCSEKALELLTKFCEKFWKECNYTYDERRLFLTFY